MNNDKKRLVITIDRESEAGAVLELLELKNRYNKSHAISFSLSNIFDTLRDKNMLNVFFSKKTIGLFEQGKSPSEILRALSLDSNPREQDENNDMKNILAEKLKSKKKSKNKDRKNQENNQNQKSEPSEKTENKEVESTPSNSKLETTENESLETKKEVVTSKKIEDEGVESTPKKPDLEMEKEPVLPSKKKKENFFDALKSQS